MVKLPPDCPIGIARARHTLTTCTGIKRAEVHYLDVHTADRSPYCESDTRDR